MKRLEPKVPDHIVAYLLHKLTGVGMVELDAEDLAEALLYRLAMSPNAGKLALTGIRVHQEDADKKNGERLV